MSAKIIPLRKRRDHLGEALDAALALQDPYWTKDRLDQIERAAATLDDEMHIALAADLELKPYRRT